MLAGLSRALVFALAIAPAAVQAQAQQLEKVTFATNWVAEAEHGGFYQALVDGTYRKAGLDVTILPGGPNVNHRLQLLAGKIQFYMSANSIQAFDAAGQNIPTLVVASMFQKDPQALFARPGGAIRDFADLAHAPVAWIAKDAQFTWWQWLKAEHGFRDAQLRPYAYNLGPFLADPRSIQQGYAVEEPIAIERQGGFRPLTFLLADHGFSTYSTLIEAREETVRARPELVQRFVDASIIGWVNYLYGDRRAGDALILRDNPDMRPETIAGSVALMKELGIVDSGDAHTLGIGAMRPERVRDFLDKMVRAGLYRPGEVDPARAVTTRFVNRGVGGELAERVKGKRP